MLRFYTQTVFGAEFAVCRLQSIPIALLIAAGLALLPLNAEAGMPRGAELSADEQDADPATGVTTARGNAEIRITAYKILGRADVIELNPGRKEILFSGHALITVGDARYESERVTCSIDFNSCVAVAGNAAAEQATIPDQSPVPHASGAATINP